MYVYVYVCYVYVCMYVYICVYVCMCVYIYIYIGGSPEAGGIASADAPRSAPARGGTRVPALDRARGREFRSGALQARKRHAHGSGTCVGVGYITTVCLYSRSGHMRCIVR